MSFLDEVVTPQGSAVPSQTVCLAGNATLSVTADGVEIKNDTGNPVPVSGTVTADSNRGNLTAASTQSITEGGTSQQLFDINNSRKYLVIQNISDTAMYLGIGFTPSSSTPRGLLLAANGGGIVFEGSYIPTGAVNIVCASTGKRFEALEA